MSRRGSTDLAMDPEKLDSSRDDNTTLEDKSGVNVVVSQHATSSPEPAPKVPTTLAADDPENPRNWKVSKKVIVNIVVCVWVLSLTFSSTAYVASLPEIVRRYNISFEVAILGVTLNIFGFAAGPLLFGPASEVYGRQAVHRVAGVGYSAFAFGVAFAPNTPGFLVMRFFDGFFGAASINNGKFGFLSISVYTERPSSAGCHRRLHHSSSTTALLFIVLVLMFLDGTKLTSSDALMAFGGPSLGPLISSFVQTEAGYRWNLRVIAIFSSVTSLMVAFVPETHGPTLLKWRLQRENKELAPKTDIKKLMSVLKVAISRPIVYLFTEPVVMLVSIYLSILYGILYGFFEAFTVVWVRTRGFSPTSYGLTYISLGLGFLCAITMVVTIGQSMYTKSAAKDKAQGIPVQPEARLILGYYGAIMCPISLFIFAWTAPYKHVHWIAPCIGEFLFSGSMLLIFTGFIPFLIDCYQLTAASALAAGMASRSFVGGIFPLFAIQMFEGLTVQGATCLLAGIACLCAPIPFIFKRYGTRLRARSKNAAVQST
ncbi:MFS transporter [Mycena indigotica]|uniref:MFS transporter n=1 Tax=Mycena indigotica TaxID=2126181 RepID=A0A8H6SEJ0_9AGAR|nr:MFS transporter [Mycena indigotica]KAF7297315.1 MFS transporter [Mycena indigotica]